MTSKTQSIKLSDIYFGHSDAKNELMENSEKQRIYFKESFIIPNNVDIKYFYNGGKSFIYGLKGTGKTALLRYLSIMFEDIYNTKSLFILFKENIKEEDKKNFARASSYFDSNQFEQNVDNDQNFEEVWRWFFHRSLVEYIESESYNVFEDDENWRKYKKHVLSLEIDEQKSGLRALIPNIKKGEVKVKAGEVGELGLDFEFTDQSKTKVKFNTVVKICDKYFENLVPTGDRLYIYIDEIELSYTTKKEYNRDARLIRDLVIAVDRFNRFCRLNKFNVFIISAIRSEVLTAIESTGKEINKIIEDFGIPISWHRFEGDYKEHPLIKIILRKIRLAEQSYFNEKCLLTDDELWDKYFDLMVQNQETEKYILYNTWYRPRDIVRLMNIAQQIYPDNIKLSHNVFDGIRKTYSAKCWTELLEEIRAVYSSKQLEALCQIFNGFTQYFSFAEINTRVDKLIEYDSDVQNLIYEHKLSNILKSLYSAGVIGNIYKFETRDRNGKMKEKSRIRFVFRGDENLLLDRNMMIHNALKQYLSLEN